MAKSKFIFVVGGVMSSVGKGVTSASIAKLIQSRGYRVTNVKGKARLYLDFAPLSFGFVILKDSGAAWINGGVIFHGAHDGYGSGSAPTYAVSVGGADGWQIHT